MDIDNTAYTMYTSGDFEIEYYEDARGRSQPREYFESMKPKHAAKARRLFQLASRMGPGLTRPYAGVLEGRIREFRPNMEGHQHRFLFVVHDRTILITNAFLKKADAVPLSEIERAERCYADWLSRGEG